MTVPWALAAAPLAKSGEAAKAGPIGLAVILLLCIAAYFLFKSMSKHMRNVRENFPVDGPNTARTTTEPNPSQQRPTTEQAQRAERPEPPAGES
ncbi:MAG TPA: hypothetical protein VFH38_02945 [Jatrophihabitans sp.]|nr:hypothetical protein [Jatrophihabitans sp.]